ncbi:hypothetical protein [Schlesneria sp.]|uniref:hypothetical protein n=1 Tax=Schlesneria sp. TaxID=2762018 RepID=UPI002EE2895A
MTRKFNTYPQMTQSDADSENKRNICENHRNLRIKTFTPGSSFCLFPANRDPPVSDLSADDAERRRYRGQLGRANLLRQRDALNPGFVPWCAAGVAAERS